MLDSRAVAVTMISSNTPESESAVWAIAIGEAPAIAVPIATTSGFFTNVVVVFMVCVSPCSVEQFSMINLT